MLWRPWYVAPWQRRDVPRPLGAVESWASTMDAPKTISLIRGNHIYLYRSNIMPGPGGHRPQRPCAQGRTCTKQDQGQAGAEEV